MAIEVHAAAGQTEVAVTIGDEAYIVDLADETGSSALEVSFDHVDFTSSDTGYQSTATLTPDFGGAAPAGPVAWTVTVLDYPAYWWWLITYSRRGLTWGTVVDPHWDWNTYEMQGTAPPGPTAQLTDIVGSRTVQVDVSSVNANGDPISDTLIVTFGNGPLSVLAVYAGPNGPWASNSSGSPGGFTSLSSPADFNFSTFCGDAVTPPVHTITVNHCVNAEYWAGWETFEVDGKTFASPIGTKMISIRQAAAAVLPNILNSNAKGASEAAGIAMTLTTSAIWYDPVNNKFKNPRIGWRTWAYAPNSYEMTYIFDVDYGDGGACVN